MDEELTIRFSLDDEQPINAKFSIEDEQQFDCVFKIDAQTFDYEALEKKPQINGVTLIGNKTGEELGLGSSEDIERLEQNIQNEATTRADNDTLLQNNINTLDEKVDGINANLTQQIEETQQDVSNKYQELTNDIDGVASALDFEIQARETADITINQRITDVADELNQTIEENVVALQQEDTTLQNQINTHSQTLTGLDTRITNNTNAITQEIADRQSGDNTLQEQVNDNASLIETKQDIITDLSTIRSNAQAGYNIIPQVESNTQRIEDLTVARFPNVVIVGTPHIEGGQVSNYSSTNYLQFPFVDISRGLPFDIYFSFTTGADITTQQNILDARFGIALAIQNSKGIMALSSNGSSWDIGSVTGTNTLQPNTTYYVKYSWTGTEYNASLSLDNQTYIPDMILQSNKSPYKTTIFIGGSPNLFGPNTAHPFKGTINFNNSKVVVNDITVWEGMADVGLASRANVSLTNLDEVGENRFLEKQNVTDNALVTLDKTVVGAVNELDAKIKDIQLFKFPDATIMGTPIINNGQVSGFSSNNYLILPFAFDTKDRAFEINMAFTTGTNVNTAQNLLGGNYCVALLIQNGNLIFRASSNGTSWNVVDITTTLNLQPNTNYFVRIEFNKLNYKVLYSTNGEDYTQIGYQVSTLAPRHGQVFIGVGNNQFNPFLGIINLNKCNIKLNTSIIWQGMDDAGLATRADISLSNLDELGQAKFDAKQDKLTAGTGIDITNNVISNTQTSAEWGNIQGTLSNQTDLQTALDSKQPTGNYALDNSVVHKANAETIPGVKTFTGGKAGSGSQPSIIATNGFYVGGYNVTGWADVTSHRLVSDKINTGSYYIDGNGSVLFRHKTGTKTAEGSANDAMFTINPVAGIKAGWSGTAGTGITDADLHDVLIDTIEYSKLNTTAKDVLGAINEVREDLSNKQDTISDLATIRSGAELGATALQSVPDEYVTDTELQVYHDSTKQDLLVSGTNIKTINNESILGAGNFDVSSIEPLSQEEYDRRKEAGELDENKYYSTPTDISLQLLEVLYPVGSLYITTTSTCPLATLGIGTWLNVSTSSNYNEFERIA